MKLPSIRALPDSTAETKIDSLATATIKHQTTDRAVVGFYEQAHQSYYPRLLR